MTRMPVDDLVELLELEVLEVNLFRGLRGDEDRQRVYGGQVAAQALMAAGRTTPEDRFVHSLHAYFLRPGDPLVPIVYEVDRIRDGGSFTTRRVVAIQHGRPIFHLSASFQLVEEGLDHAAMMPDVPLPDDLPSGVEATAAYRDLHLPGMVSFYDDDGPIELRSIGDSGLSSGPTGATRDLWLRTRGRLSDDPLLHACVMTYASDLALIGTTLVPHREAVGTGEFMLASLDHAVWFHRAFRADEWLLYHQTSPSAAGARGLGLGSLFRIDGSLVATVVQEGLIRPKRASGRSPAASR